MYKEIAWRWGIVGRYWAPNHIKLNTAKYWFRFQFHRPTVLPPYNLILYVQSPAGAGGEVFIHVLWVSLELIFCSLRNKHKTGHWYWAKIVINYLRVNDRELKIILTNIYQFTEPDKWCKSMNAGHNFGDKVKIFTAVSLLNKYKQ